MDTINLPLPSQIRDDEDRRRRERLYDLVELALCLPPLMLMASVAWWLL